MSNNPEQPVRNKICLTKTPRRELKMETTCFRLTDLDFMSHSTAKVVWQFSCWRKTPDAPYMFRCRIFLYD